MAPAGFSTTFQSPGSPAIARVADGVVVGSALVELVGEYGAAAPEHLRTLTASLADGVHSARKEPA